MALTDIPLQDIREEDLARLVSTQAAESLYVEYKRETYGTNDESRKEFLADISSFANAQGGDLIVGMEAAHGVPIGFNPFAGDADAERLRLEAMARSAMEPRITDLHTRAIPLKGGGTAIVIRIPKSPFPPHRVIFKGGNRFWVRSSAGKFEPNVEELRQIFLRGPQRMEQIRAFHAKRLREIGSDDTPVPVFDDRPLLVLHVVPYVAFDAGYGVEPGVIADQDGDFPPMGGKTNHWFVNFDGFLALSNRDENATQRAYVQVFRNGIVESVAALSAHAVETVKLEEYIVRYAGWYANTLHRCGVPAPYAVLVSLLRAKGASFITEHKTGSTPLVSERVRYRFPAALLTHLPEGAADTGPSLRPILDRVAALGGVVESPSFDHDGNYIRQLPPPPL